MKMTKLDIERDMAPVAWMDKDLCILHEEERETPIATLERVGWQPLYLHPAQSRDAIIEECAKRDEHWSVINGIGDVLRGDVLDAAIDVEK